MIEINNNLGDLEKIEVQGDPIKILEGQRRRKIISKTDKPNNEKDK